MDSPIRSHSGRENDNCGRRTPTQRNMSWSRFSDTCIIGNVQMSGYAEVDEIGWGDSPEPLKIDHTYVPKKKSALSETPTSHRKKTVRPTKGTALVLAAEQELAIIKKIAQSFKNAEAATSSISSTISSSKMSNFASTDTKDINSNTNTPDSKSSLNCPSTASCSSKMTDCISSDLPNFNTLTDDQDLKKLLEDDDDVWLSQVDLGDTCQTPKRGKNSLVKSRSENQLDSPSPSRSGSFRRSYSFQPSIIEPPSARNDHESSASTNLQPLKKQKSFHVELLPGQTKCTAEQIEQKRLEAIYRREFREIERRKLEAQKRLNERRARLALGGTKR